jgi:hypothetical protein
VSEAPQQQQSTKGIEGRPNGKTAKRLVLKRMSTDERRAHRKQWKRAAQAVRAKARGTVGKAAAPAATEKQAKKK